jgi:hypothetical protein
MNERIGKLAVKAGAHWEHGDWNMPSAVYFSEKDLEKFAQLIVKECAMIGELKEQGSNDYDHKISVGWYMRQHFGVE